MAAILHFHMLSQHRFVIRIPHESHLFCSDLLISLYGFRFWSNRRLIYILYFGYKCVDNLIDVNGNAVIPPLLYETRFWSCYEPIIVFSFRSLFLGMRCNNSCNYLFTLKWDSKDFWANVSLSVICSITLSTFFPFFVTLCIHFYANLWR